MRIFSSFKSKWQNPLLCMAPTAVHIYLKRPTNISLSVKHMGCPSVWNCSSKENESHSHSSMAIHYTLFLVEVPVLYCARVKSSSLLGRLFGTVTVASHVMPRGFKM